MAKELSINYEGKDYTLGFTRDTVRQMERKGFNVVAAERSPMTSVYDLFSGAFLAHHKNVDQKKVSEMFDKISDLEELTDFLMEMYRDPFETLTDKEKAGEIKPVKSW